MASKGGWPWIADSDPNNWYVPTTIDNNSVAYESEIEVLTDHPILDDMDIAVGGKFSVGTDVSSDFKGKAKYQTFNITDDANVFSNAVAVGKSTHAQANGAPVTNILYAIEENPSSQRCVVLGTHQGFLEYMTDELGKLTTGAVKWLLKMDGTATLTIDNSLPDFKTKIFPNPTDDKVTIQFSVSKSLPVDIRLFNAIGETVFTYTNFCSAGIFEKQIDVSSFVNGLYLVKVRIQGKEQVQKLLVK